MSVLKEAVFKLQNRIPLRFFAQSSEHHHKSHDNLDVVIVGGGIVGCATARELISRHPQLKFAILEKENRLAVHQSGRNSGVIHAGIYYAPGSLKAKLCVRGMDLSYKYFDQHKIPYKKCGKLIVAVEPHEISRLDTLFEKGKKNGCRDLQVIPGERIKEFEPHCKGLKAIWSPHTGIVDWGAVTNAFGREFVAKGGLIMVESEVTNFHSNAENPKSGQPIEYPVKIERKNKPPIHCKFVLTCGGLQSDRLAVKSGCSPLPKIVPFRGEYLLLKPEKKFLVRGNIYPVPDPGFPFLGVHFTPRMNGDVWLGPNAVLAFRREGYGYLEISLKDTLESLSFRGMQKLMRKYMAFGTKEFYRGIWTNAQVKQLQRFVPELQPSDVTRGPTGVRAQAMDADGNLVDDFVFDAGQGDLGKRLMHVRNAPSPAATSSLAIAEMVADAAEKAFHLPKH